MKYLSFIIICIVIAISWGKRSQSDKSDSSVVTIDSAAIADSIDLALIMRRNMEFQRWHILDYLASQRDTVLYDSRLENVEAETHTVVKSKCLFDNGIVIPTSYFQFDTTDIRIHDYVLEVKFIKPDDTLVVEITRERLKDHIPVGLMEHAVFYGPHYRGFSTTDSCHYIFTSFTIPSTDVGIGLDVRVDLHGNIFVE